jgi:hypothetical protein
MLTELFEQFVKASFHKNTVQLWLMRFVSPNLSNNPELNCVKRPPILGFFGIFM